MRRISLYIALILMLFTSCHSSKKVVTEKDIKQLEMSALYDTIVKHYGDYQTVKFGFSIDLEDFKSLPQIKGNIRIKKDSIVWIGVSAMSIDVFRAIITQDSVKFYSKLQKTYYAGNLADISKEIGLSIDYKTIQSILLDELFFCQQDNVDTVSLFKSFEINKKDNKFVFQTHSKKEFKKNDTLSFLQTWQVLNDNFRISEVDIVDEGTIIENKIKLTYSDFEELQNISFPTNMSLKAKMPNGKFHFDMKYSKVSFDEELNFPFNPSSSYQKMEPKLK